VSGKFRKHQPTTRKCLWWVQEASTKYTEFLWRVQEASTKYTEMSMEGSGRKRQRQQERKKEAVLIHEKGGTEAKKEVRKK
jgi:hypothetical protein